MTLENQIVSLELAKKLKELGVEQESLFWWWFPAKDIDQHNARIVTYPEVEGAPTFDYLISAFTVAELGEMLPKSYYSGKLSSGGFICFKKSDNEKQYLTHTEADARAKMLIYLLENNLTTFT